MRRSVMTLTDIKYTYVDAMIHINNDAWLWLLKDACPQLSYIARPLVAKYRDKDPREVTQDEIAWHLIHIYEYDVIDIGRILTKCRRYSSNGR